ncbi:SigE family RNA polymerase sigma factor [Streptacidiphilus melanogenes]|uniref:SigE family RNA polymerase sigma factor n=1 Tax=Streptacidiphilus melanogenes TaxID=411235 RepID=UPI0005A920E4|nr:SigE family RNA polymerase sigma factor [Streptacidiphilus melanogenes]
MHRDDPELREFLSHRRHALLRSAYLMCGDTHAAEDLVQTTLIKVVMARRGRRRIEHLDAYARRTLVNTFIASRRRLWHRERPHEQLPDAPAPGGADADLGLAVRAALQRLAPRQRAVLVLRFFEDQSVHATAELLGVSEGTVKSQTARGLEVLRATLRHVVGDAVGEVVDEELTHMHGVNR